MSDGTVPAPADNTPTSPAAAHSILSGLAAPDPVSPAAPAAPSAPAAPAAPVQSGTWRDKLPEDLRAVPSLTKLDSEEAMARSYINLEKMLGQDKVPIPRDEQDTEAWNRLYKAVGRPEKHSDYKYEAPKDLPAGVTYDESKVEYVKQVAHQNGFNQRQFDNAMKALYEDQVKSHAAWQAQQQNARAEGERALELTGQRKEIETLAKATVQQYFDEAALAKLDQAGLGNDPIIIRALANIGKDLTGHQVLKGRGGDTIKTEAQMKNEVGEFQSKHAAALQDQSHPDHKMRVNEFEQMMRKMYPEQASA
jgi:hypothetical protein